MHRCVKSLSIVSVVAQNDGHFMNFFIATLIDHGKILMMKGALLSFAWWTVLCILDSFSAGSIPTSLLQMWPAWGFYPIPS